jgi:hypothetical protein
VTPRTRATDVATLLAVVLGVIGATLVPTGIARAASRTNDDASVNDAFAIVNHYRLASGLNPVAIDPSLNGPAQIHSCWMADNDTLGHGDGHDDGSGLLSDIAVARSELFTDERFVNLWMTGPYHAMGLLRAGLARGGYGTCTDGNGYYHKGATFDVLSGYRRVNLPNPVVFPGQGSTTDLTSFISEDPNPLHNCGWDTAGLPVFTMLPEAPLPSTTATMTGPGGPVEVCVVTEHDDVTNGQSLLHYDRAVLVIPKEPLSPGTWQVHVDTGVRLVDWSFDVGLRRQLPNPVLNQTRPATEQLAPAGRYVADGPRRVLDTRQSPGTPVAAGDDVVVPLGPAPAGATAAVVTVTATQVAEPGWVAVYPCALGYDGTSNVNDVPWADAANTAIVPLAGGELCARTSSTAHLVVDLSGWFVAGGGGAGFTSREVRLADTRSGGALGAGQQLRVEVPAAGGAVAAALNVTTTGSGANGYLTVWPCDAPRPDTSVSQATATADRATSAIIALAADASVCVWTSVDTHVVVDLQGLFVPTGGTGFVPLRPFRAVDTRNGPHPWSSTAVRVSGDGMYPFVLPVDFPGLPGGAVAMAANYTLTTGSEGAWMQAARCAPGGGPSTVNAEVGRDVANQSIAGVGMVPLYGVPTLSSCVTMYTSAHVIVDVTGVFVPTG